MDRVTPRPKSQPFSFVILPSLPPLGGLPVEFAEEGLHFAVVLFCFFQGRLDVLQRRRLVRFGDSAGFILAGAVVLDLLTRLLDLVEAECGRRALEEVTQRGEFRQLLLVSGWGMLAGCRDLSEEYLQSLAHLVEGALRLIEETVHNTLAEVAVIIVVHLEDLFEGRLVDALVHLVEGGRCLVVLGD